MRLYRADVYFARASDGTFKIGHTQHAESRMSSLKSERKTKWKRPVEFVTLLAYCIGTQETEKRFRDLLNEVPIIGREWFAPTRSAIAFFRAIVEQSDESFANWTRVGDLRSAVLERDWCVPSAESIAKALADIRGLTAAPYSRTAQLARTGS